MVKAHGRAPPPSKFVDAKVAKCREQPWNQGLGAPIGLKTALAFLARQQLPPKFIQGFLPSGQVRWKGAASLGIESLTEQASFAREGGAHQMAPSPFAHFPACGVIPKAGFRQPPIRKVKASAIGSPGGLHPLQCLGK